MLEINAFPPQAVTTTTKLLTHRLATIPLPRVSEFICTVFKFLNTVQIHKAVQLVCNSNEDLNANFMANKLPGR